MTTNKKRLMIVDSNNMYLRNFIVNPSISTSGNPIGGLKGFLQSIQKESRLIKPSLIICVWDGIGGSRKRKSIVKGYKDGRKPIRLNRSARNMSEEAEEQNRLWQQARLIEYINETPIIQFMEDGIEADDIIAMIARLPLYKEYQKVIISSDKDFLQLCDDSTVLYRPMQDEVLNKKQIVEKYGVHPNNFALARAVAGDSSDNLPGVQGVGLKTVAKKFPFLSEEKQYTISELVESCEQQEEKLKVHNNIIEQEGIISLNYKMMQLYKPSISVQKTKKIKAILEESDISFNNTEIQSMMMQDGFGEFNWNDLYTCFRRIVNENKENSA